MSKINQYAKRLGLYSVAARSDITSHLLPFARPPEPRLRGPRLNTAATSAAADLIGDIMGLAVRSMIPCRVTAHSIAREAGNREKLPDTHPGYPPPSPFKYRPLAKAADFPLFYQHITQIAPDEQEVG